MTQQSSLAVEWQRAAEDLGLDIVAPFTVHLMDGSIQVPVLLRHFGARLGMLLTTDYEPLEPFARELVDAGYGFSVLSEPSDGESYSRDSIIELLSDWGWSGPSRERPTWLADPQPSEE